MEILFKVIFLGNKNGSLDGEYLGLENVVEKSERVGMHKDLTMKSCSLYFSG